MRGVLFAGGAELVQFKAILEDFLVLVRAVVELFASRALEFDEVILGHIWVKSCWKISETSGFCQLAVVMKDPGADSGT